MKDKKNRAVISHREKTFVMYQDEKDNWCYTFEDLTDVNSQTKDLQTALNVVKETINERLVSESRSKRETKLGNWKAEGKFPFQRKKKDESERSV